MVPTTNDPTLVKYFFSKKPIEKPRQLLKWFRFEFGANCGTFSFCITQPLNLPFASLKLANSKLSVGLSNENKTQHFHLTSHNLYVCFLPVFFQTETTTLSRYFLFGKGNYIFGKLVNKEILLYF